MKIKADARVVVQECPKQAFQVPQKNCKPAAKDAAA